MTTPRRLPLARTGTPLQALPRTSAALAVEVLVKRDDLTGAERDLCRDIARDLEERIALLASDAGQADDRFASTAPHQLCAGLRRMQLS